MFPSRSIAALPIQRQVESGWYVLSCATVTGPLLTLRSSNQRIPATLPELTV
jgi:hypothetical protein